MENLCRICLRSSDHLTSLCADAALNTKIETLASLQLTKNDDYPPNICQECTTKINASSNLRKLIINSNKELEERSAVFKRLKNRKQPTSDQKFTHLLKLLEELFEDAEKGDVQVLNKLQTIRPEAFLTITNARNDQGHSLVQVATMNNHKNIAKKLLEMLKSLDINKSCSNADCKLDRLGKLKSATENHVRFSESYLPMLRSMSEIQGSEENSWPWKSLKHGSYYLGNVHKLIKTYMKAHPGTISDENIQAINSTLAELEFDIEHINIGFTDETFDGKPECFVSRGQGTVYYTLLHSKLKRDVRFFLQIVEHDIDAPVRRFLNSVTQKLESLGLEKLFEAIKNNNCGEVETCITKGAIIGSKNIDGWTPLHYAVSNGHPEVINSLLSHGADPTQVTNKGNTPLHMAALKGSKDIVEVLLQHVGRDGLNEFINAKTSTRRVTSLHVAAENGSLDIAKSLLKHGAIYNTEDKAGNTPFALSNNERIAKLLKLIEELFEDAKTGNDQIISKLREVEVDVIVAAMNACDSHGRTLMEVAETNKHTNITSRLQEIMENPDNIKSVYISQWTPDQLQKLISAAEDLVASSKNCFPNLTSMIESQRLVDEYWGVQAALNQGRRYLISAWQLVKLYKEYQPGPFNDKNVQEIEAALSMLGFEIERVTPEYDSKIEDTLCYKLLHNNEAKENIKMFIEITEGIPVSAKILESICFVELFEALDHNDCSEISNCLWRGKRAIVNLKNDKGQTSLHYAVNNGNLDVINTLLLSGADPTHVTTEGNTSLHIAVSKGCKEITEVLLQHVRRDKFQDFINAQTVDEGFTALHLAAQNGFLEIVKSLLNHGSIFNTCDKKGTTACDLSKNKNIIILLKILRNLFEDVKTGKHRIVTKLKELNRSSFAAVINARNDQGNTLLQVLMANKHTIVENKIRDILKNGDKVQESSSPDFTIEQLKSLKDAAKKHLEFSDLYFPMLRGMSAHYGSETNSDQWKALKEGSYYLGNVADFVHLYKKLNPGPITDKNMQMINSTLVDLEFVSNHISAGYTDEAYGGTTRCFVSKGSGTVYYKLLHSEFKNDVRLFLQLATRDLDAPARRFLVDVERKLQSTSYFL